MGKGHKFLWTRKTCQLVSIYKRKKRKGKQTHKRIAKRQNYIGYLQRKKIIGQLTME